MEKILKRFVCSDMIKYIIIPYSIDKELKNKCIVELKDIRRCYFCWKYFIPEKYSRDPETTMVNYFGITDPYWHYYFMCTPCVKFRWKSVENGEWRKVNMYLYQHISDRYNDSVKKIGYYEQRNGSTCPSGRFIYGR